jgi:hypothetical protein
MFGGGTSNHTPLDISLKFIVCEYVLSSNEVMSLKFKTKVETVPPVD